MIHHMKRITWGISPDPILMQVDIQVSSMVQIIISNKGNGGPIRAISSTRTRVDHLIGLSKKGLAYIIEPLSWRRPLLSLCRSQCPTTRTRSLPSKTLESKWGSWPNRLQKNLLALLVRTLSRIQKKNVRLL